MIGATAERTAPSRTQKSNDVRIGGYYEGSFKQSVTANGTPAASFWLNNRGTRVKINLYKDLSVLEKLTPDCFLFVTGELMNRAWRGKLFLEVLGRSVEIESEQVAQGAGTDA